MNKSTIKGCKSSGVLDADTSSEGLGELGRPAALLGELVTNHYKLLLTQ
jgi:hypothetical protein